MDRFSELPDSLIHHILGFLPTNDVVRTMVLSKQWKTLWSTTTSLTFNDSINTDRFRSFVDGVLASWKGCKIEKFRVTRIFGDEESLHRDINVWVRWALERGVRDLYLDLLHYPVEDVKQVVFWSPPQSLYSCSSLHRLFIFGCKLEINENVEVEWRNLNELHMEGYGFTQAVINQVLGGSPKLDQLALTVFQSNEGSLSIQSSSLRYLLLHKYMVPSLDSELRICAPNLETLKLYGFLNYRCLVMKVASLTAAALRSCSTGENYDFIGMTVAQILPDIQHVDDDPNCCIMAIGAVELKNMLASVKLVKLKNEAAYEEIARLLANVPKLETLVLQPVVEYTPSRKPRGVETESLEFSNLPYSSLQQQQLVSTRVKVTWTDTIYTVLEIILQCASEHHEYVFRVQQLLGMPRPSPTAHFVIRGIVYRPPPSVYYSIY